MGDRVGDPSGRQLPFGPFKAEGPGRCTFDIEPMAGAVKLTITHEIDRLDSKLIHAVSGGWPLVLSNLKSLLETGEIVVTKL